MQNIENLENDELEKDEIQLMKAKMKIEASKTLITHLIHMNDEININEQKKYTIVLDYIEFDDYTKFQVNIIRGNHGFTNQSLFHVNFSLKDLELGLALFDEIRDCYLEKGHLIYTGFSHFTKIRENLYDSFDATGANHVDLKYVIHTQEEQDKLIKFNNSLYERPNANIKMKKVIRCEQS